MKASSTALLFLVALFAIWTELPSTAAERKALPPCPKPTGAGICVEMCSREKPCGPGERCCSNGCGHTCVKVTRALTQKGQCPKPKGVGICAEMCSSAKPCGPGERCCSNGCGHECMKVTGGSR